MRGERPTVTAVNIQTRHSAARSTRSSTTCAALRQLRLGGRTPCRRPCQHAKHGTDAITRQRKINTLAAQRRRRCHAIRVHIDAAEKFPRRPIYWQCKPGRTPDNARPPRRLRRAQIWTPPKLTALNRAAHDDLPRQGASHRLRARPVAECSITGSVALRRVKRPPRSSAGRNSCPRRRRARKGRRAAVIACIDRHDRRDGRQRADRRRDTTQIGYESLPERAMVKGRTDRRSHW